MTFVAIGALRVKLQLGLRGYRISQISHQEFVLLWIVKRIRIIATVLL